jgi:hypothetical protein
MGLGLGLRARLRLRGPLLIWILSLTLFVATSSNVRATAYTPIDEESPWPRVRATNGNAVTIHLPQVESWTSNSFKARAAVEVKLANEKSDLVGVAWFEAHGSVDHSNRIVNLDHFEITKARFPDSKDNGSNALSVLRELVPAGARTVSLDYLITTLGFLQAAARQGVGGLKHTPPNIIWVTNRTVLILVDGEPMLRAVPGSTLKRVINTPALIVQCSGTFYLSGEGRWFSAESLQSPWSLAIVPPAEVLALDGGLSPSAPSRDEEDLPRILVSTSPAELLTTLSLPDFKPIRGTALQYAADSDSQLFFHTTEREAYLLASGRWFKAKSLRGPWTYIAPHELPADFARINPGSPQGVVLASVPDTPQADLALLANSVPATATVDRHQATIELSYDGEPQFKGIEGTQLRYAINAQLPVIQAGETYYALDDAVWFTASGPTGPWQVATEIPEEIYTIPPGSPVYYATFVRVYEASDDEVEVGYTAGYQGAYEDEGTVVYGTGWDYDPWYGNEYYGWGWTWGYSYVYVPWYQWWVWRPWWNQPGGLRAAVIENIYDRWQGRNGVTHYDSSALSAPSAPSAPRAPSAERAATADRAVSAERAASAERAGSAERAASAPRAPSAPSFGYPALYGRFKGATQLTALSPPPNTLALNPYLRPQSSYRAGEIPNGAQLLSSIRQAPGGGRDLYASPDGVVYRRRTDGWYRREAGGGWSFFAPTQGRLEREAGSTRANQFTGAAGVPRPVLGPGAAQGRGQGRLDRVPDSGARVRAQEVAALERQYYARALAQIRTQNWRASGNVSRRGGRRR